MHGACLDAVHDRGALLRSPAPAALCSGSFVRKSTALSRRDCRSESCLGEWISNNRRSLVLQAYGTRRACSKSGPAGRGSAGLQRKTLAPDVGPGPQLTAGPKLGSSFCQRPVLNPCHGEITSSDVIGCTIAIAICSSPYFCLCTNQQPQAPVALGQSKKRAGVACDHEFLVSGNDPSRDFAFLRGYPRISINVGSCV